LDDLIARKGRQTGEEVIGRYIEKVLEARGYDSA
jgi:hypothetical protein